MKRRLDLIRDILLNIEKDTDYDGTGWYQFDNASDLGLEDCTYEELAYHLTLLIEADLIVGQTTMRMPMVSRLTWRGHEFIEDIREPDVWKKTRDGAQKVGNAGLQFMWDLAKAYGKQLAKEKLQLDL